MAKLEKQEIVTVRNLLQLSDAELKGLYTLLSFGVEPAVLSELSLYDLQRVLNNNVGIDYAVDLKFSRARFASPVYEDDYDECEPNCECG